MAARESASAKVWQRESRRARKCGSARVAEHESVAARESASAKVWQRESRRARKCGSARVGEHESVAARESASAKVWQRESRRESRPPTLALPNFRAPPKKKNT